MYFSQIWLAKLAVVHYGVPVIFEYDNRPDYDRIDQLNVYVKRITAWFSILGNGGKSGASIAIGNFWSLC